MSQPNTIILIMALTCLGLLLLACGPAAVPNQEPLGNFPGPPQQADPTETPDKEPAAGPEEDPTPEPVPTICVSFFMEADSTEPTTQCIPDPPPPTPKYENLGSLNRTAIAAEEAAESNGDTARSATKTEWLQIEIIVLNSPIGWKHRADPMKLTGIMTSSPS